MNHSTLLSEEDTRTVQEALPCELIACPAYGPGDKINSAGYESILSLTEDNMAPAGEVSVRPYQDHYELMTGEEYFRAYKAIFPQGKLICTVVHYNDSQAVYHVLSRAMRYYSMHLLDVIECYPLVLQHFGWTQSALARALKISRSALSNQMRLRNLTSEVKDQVKQKKLGLEQAKYLSRLTPAKQKQYARLAIFNQWDTRTLYAAINPEWSLKDQGKKVSANAVVKDRGTLVTENKMSEYFGTQVSLRLNQNKNFEGQVALPFHSLDALLGLLERLAQVPDSKAKWKGELLISIDNLSHINTIIQDIMPELFES